MSGPIKKGDLVMVVRLTACCAGGQLGLVTRVEGVEPDEARRCTGCGRVTDGAVAHCEDGETRDVSRLKKIDPPATGEYDRVPVRKTQPRKVPA